VQHDLHSEAADPVHRVITLAEDVRADLVVVGMQKRSAPMSNHGQLA
jgi:nucleotide-binding universal stress UspA family protein